VHHRVDPAFCQSQKSHTNVKKLFQVANTSDLLLTVSSTRSKNGYRSFVQNGVVEIPKFDAKPNPSSNPDPNYNPNPNPIRFGQMTLRTSEVLSPKNRQIYFP